MVRCRGALGKEFVVARGRTFVLIATEQGIGVTAWLV